MASIGNDPNGRKRILFIALDGKRQTLRLGKVSESVAGEAKAHVEKLLDALRTGREPKDSTLAWVEEQAPEVRERMVRLGLVPASEAADGLTLKAFTDKIIAQKVKLKAKHRTLDVMQRAADSLITYFGAEKRLSEITPGDARQFREHLLAKGGVRGGKLAVSTTNDRCKKAKQFFNSAIEFRLIDSNPFAKLPTAVRSESDRIVYVSKHDTERVIEAASDAEFRLLIALCRYAGLRNPSETLSLRWEHVDFANDRMTVPSPKTEHHPGRATRVVPLFPELRPYLEDAWELCQDVSEPVIRRWRDSGKNFRTRMRATIRRAGLEPWPKTFHTLRSSCQTDLAEEFPLHVVCAWLGNSEQVARDHYLQVTEEHFARAAHNPAQHTPARGGMRQNRTPEFATIPAETQQFDGHEYTPQDSKSAAITDDSGQRGTDSGTHTPCRCQSDMALAALVARWADLDEETQYRILEVAGVVENL